MGSRKQSRNFALVTYLPKHVITAVLSSHWERIEWYAGCTHDRDKLYPLNEDSELKPVHTHICIKTRNPYTPKTIRNWFVTDYVDEKGMQVNTLVQFSVNFPGSVRYLRHLDDPHKTQYGQDEVFTNNPDLEEYMKEDAPAEECGLLSAAYDMLRGLTYANLARKYGRDFIIYYKRVEAFAQLLAAEDRDIYESTITKEYLEEFNHGSAQRLFEELNDWEIEEES